MKKNMALALGVLAALMVPCAFAADGEDARPWTDSAEFGLVITSGNTETTNVSFGNKFTYTWENAEFISNAFALRNESTRRTATNIGGTLVVNELEELTAEAYGIDGKYRRSITDAFFWYVVAGWDKDTFAGIDSRIKGGAGVGYRFFTDDTHTLVGEIGADWTDETYLDDTSDSFAGARGFLGYLRNLSETSKFTSDLEVLQNLDESDDLRAIWANALTASLTSKLALKVSYTMKYDNQPVVQTISAAPGFPGPDVLFEFDDLDTLLSASLVINF